MIKGILWRLFFHRDQPQNVDETDFITEMIKTDSFDTPFLTKADVEPDKIKRRQAVNDAFSIYLAMKMTGMQKNNPDEFKSIMEYLVAKLDYYEMQIKGGEKNGNGK